jgi:hypothetical protein
MDDAMKFVFLLLLCAGCAHSEPCDPGQIYAHGVCYAPVDAGPAPADAVAHD